MSEFFTSDWHLGHENILKLGSGRPFSSIQEMNEAIFNYYSSIVKEEDIVYFLGDMAFNGELISYFFREVYNPKTRFVFILGNHDRKYLKHINNVIKDFNNVKVVEGLFDIVLYDQPITLCHYPMITWNRSHFGAWQLYGHHHLDYSGEYKYLKKNVPSMGKQINVSCDLNNFAPISFEEIKEKMSIRDKNWDLIKEN